MGPTPLHVARISIVSEKAPEEMKKVRHEKKFKKAKSLQLLRLVASYHF